MSDEEIADIETFISFLVPSRCGVATHFTCKQFDRGKRMCRIYEKRPGICRDYGTKVPCQHPDCQWKDARRVELKPRHTQTVKEVASDQRE